MERLFETLPETTVTIRVDPGASVAPIREALDRLFDTDRVVVAEGSAEQPAEVVVVRGDEVVAASSAESLLQSLLLVNSDIYITGTRGLDDAALPDALKALCDIPFRLRGFPESDSEKLLLIAVSRAIERRAAEAGAGTLRVGFQRLSRLVDEPGTYRVYERLADTDLAVHAYGVGDTTLPAELDVTTHIGTSRLHRKGWFLVFEPTASDVGSAGLYAIDRGENDWEGFFSFDPSRVESMRTVIAELATKQPQ